MPVSSDPASHASTPAFPSGRFFVVRQAWRQDAGRGSRALGHDTAAHHSIASRVIAPLEHAIAQPALPARRSALVGRRGGRPTSSNLQEGEGSGGSASRMGAGDSPLAARDSLARSADVAAAAGSGNRGAVGCGPPPAAERVAENLPIVIAQRAARVVSSAIMAPSRASFQSSGQPASGERPSAPPPARHAGMWMNPTSAPASLPAINATSSRRRPGSGPVSGSPDAGVSGFPPSRE